MPEWAIALLTAFGAGMSVPAGALLARIEQVQPNWRDEELRHSVIAFGGGALVSAVALVLVPDGMESLPLLPAAVIFALGGLAFFWLDRFFDAHRTSASQLSAMLADFIPEALALGAVFAVDANTAYLLAVLIALQNLPEAFNASREIEATTRASGGRVAGVFFAIGLLGPAAAMAGFFWLVDWPALVGTTMLFASGGILYLVFQDIAPQARLERHWAPPLGAVAGFLLGMIGHGLIAA